MESYRQALRKHSEDLVQLRAALHTLLDSLPPPGPDETSGRKPPSLTTHYRVVVAEVSEQLVPILARLGAAAHISEDELSVEFSEAEAAAAAARAGRKLRDRVLPGKEGFAAAVVMLEASVAEISSLMARVAILTRGFEHLALRQAVVNDDSTPVADEDEEPA